MVILLNQVEDPTDRPLVVGKKIRRGSERLQLSFLVVDVQPLLLLLPILALQTRDAGLDGTADTVCFGSSELIDPGVDLLHQRFHLLIDPSTAMRAGEDISLKGWW